MNKVIIFILITLSFCSCARGKKKVREVKNNIAQKIDNKMDDAIDKAFPHFNSYEADTKWNKRRFKEFLNVELSEDISHIYCYDSGIGIDGLFLFSFKCNESTINKIRDVHHLTPDTAGSFSSGFLEYDFEWWNIEYIKKLPLYTWSKEDRFFKYLWYDSDTQTAYYALYDL